MRASEEERETEKYKIKRDVSRVEILVLYSNFGFANTVEFEGSMENSEI